MLGAMQTGGRLFHTPSFLDRSAMFSILRPKSQLLSLLTGVEQPAEALARASQVSVHPAPSSRLGATRGTIE